MFETKIDMTLAIAKDTQPYCDCGLTLAYHNQTKEDVVVVEDALITGFLGKLLAVTKESVATG